MVVVYVKTLDMNVMIEEQIIIVILIAKIIVVYVKEIHVKLKEELIDQEVDLKWIYLIN